jgi:hypothetical protein
MTSDYSIAEKNLNRYNEDNSHEEATMKRLPVIFAVLLVVVLAALAVRAGTPVFLPHASLHFSPLCQVTDDLLVKLSRSLAVHVVARRQRRFSLRKRLPSCARR